MSNKDLLKNEEKQLIKKTFDFRKWLKQFEFSKEAKDLYNSALKIFKWYHSTGKYENCGFQKSQGPDFNDSFYDITNAIMGKDNHEFTEMDTRQKGCFTESESQKAQLVLEKAQSKKD